MRRFKGNLPEHLFNPSEKKGSKESELLIISSTEKIFTERLILPVCGRIDAILHLINPSLFSVVLPLLRSEAEPHQGH